MCGVWGGGGGGGGGGRGVWGGGGEVCTYSYVRVCVILPAAWLPVLFQSSVCRFYSKIVNKSATSFEANHGMPDHYNY